jgi:hypothetical protein
MHLASARPERGVCGIALPVQAKVLWLVIILPTRGIILSGTVIVDDDHGR